MTESDTPQEIFALRQRVDELEITVSFQERTIGQLNASVIAFTQRVEELGREVQQLRSKDSEPQVGPQNDPPPHY